MAISKVSSASAAPVKVEAPKARPSAPPPKRADAFEPAKATPVVLQPPRAATANKGSRGTNDDAIGNGTREGLTRQLDALGPARPAAPRGSVSLVGLDARSAATAQKLLARPDLSGDVAFALGSGVFASLDAKQKAQFVDVLATVAETPSASNGARLMAKACESANVGGQGTDGSSALDNLQRMMKANMVDGALNVMADIVLPNRIWQGNAPTCTATTMQYELAKSNAGEYSRLMAGLALEGQVTMAGGGRLEVDVAAAVSAGQRAGDQRSSTEAVFQSAVMDYANGADAYDLSAMKSVRRPTAPGGLGRPTRSGERADSALRPERPLERPPEYEGLFPEQIVVVTGQLFGRTYEARGVSNPLEAASVLSSLVASKQPNRPVLVNIDIPADPRIPGDQGSLHCVAFEGMADGQVQLRDPATGKSSQVPVQRFIENLCDVFTAAPTTTEPRWDAPQAGSLFVVG